MFLKGWIYLCSYEKRAQFDNLRWPRLCVAALSMQNNGYLMSFGREGEREKEREREKLRHHGNLQATTSFSSLHALYLLKSAYTLHLAIILDIFQNFFKKIFGRERRAGARYHKYMQVITRYSCRYLRYTRYI